MIELMPHQLEARDKLSNGRVLWGNVGSGKSIAVLAYYMKTEQPKDIYVITTAKKRDHLDWEKEAAHFGIGTESTGTVAGVLTVDSWNNIGKYIDIEDAYFVFDEQRVVGGGAWVKAFYKIARKNKWNLLSATPGDTWMDYIPIFVANNLYKNSTQFKREHVVYAPYSKFPKIVRYTGIQVLERWRNLILVEMPYAKHTTRHTQILDMDHDVDLMKKVINKRWNVYEDAPLKDAGEMFRVMRRLVNSDPSRLDAIRELLKTHPRLIIYYSFDYELEILRQLYGEVEVGEWNGHRKHPLPETDSWVYLVQYVAGAEGWNCITTDTVVFYSLTYSYKNFEQAQGRIDRLNTPFVDLHYCVFLSDSRIDGAIMDSLDGKHHFNERASAVKEFGWK